MVVDFLLIKLVIPGANMLASGGNNANLLVLSMFVEDSEWMLKH
jgi:hypothetical protein